MSTKIENYCIQCNTTARPNCESRGHVVGTLGKGAAVNNHDALIEALKTSADWFHDTHRNVFGPDLATCGHGQCEASRSALAATKE